MKRIAKFETYATLVTALFPLTLILFTLASFGLGMTVVKFMMHHSDTVPTSTAETRYEWILLLGLLSMFVAPVTLIMWLALWSKRHKPSLPKDQQVPRHPPLDY